MSSLRPMDMRSEKALADFMDDFFYPTLKGKDNKEISHERIKDRARQLRGIDVILIDGNGKKTIVDEKASMHYGNCMLPTFAFELSSIQTGDSIPVEGWLTKDDMDTDYYLLIWPNIKCVKDEKSKKYFRKDLDKLTKYDFTIVEAMFISRKRLLEYLESLGLSKDVLRDKAVEIREIMEKHPKEKGKHPCLNGKNGIEYHYTDYLSEKPINLLIRRKTLKSLARGHVYLITEDGCARIKS